MTTLQLKDLRKVGKKIRAFLKESKKNDRKVLLTPKELLEYNGCQEELFMTNIGDAILVHYGTAAEWTKSLLIPNGEFDVKEEADFYGPVDEALEWFFK